MSIRDMIKNSILESSVYQQTVSMSTILTIFVNMSIALCAGIVIYFVYRNYFQGVVFSKPYAYTLVGMTVLTCMVTLAISTNIVISLGMVGALSIVRYRTAIKEPMDLLYMFWAITSGITVGASMYILAAIGAIIMIAMLAVLNIRSQSDHAYIMIVHLKEQGKTDAVIEKLGNIKYKIKSQIFREEETELTLQLVCRDRDLSFSDDIRACDNVKDVTLVQYNGEYHG